MRFTSCTTTGGTTKSLCDLCILCLLINIGLQLRTTGRQFILGPCRLPMYPHAECNPISGGAQNTIPSSHFRLNGDRWEGAGGGSVQINFEIT